MKWKGLTGVFNWIMFGKYEYFGEDRDEVFAYFKNEREKYRKLALENEKKKRCKK
jgi:hypothetical protein